MEGFNQADTLVFQVATAFMNLAELRCSLIHFEHTCLIKFHHGLTTDFESDNGASRVYFQCAHRHTHIISAVQQGLVSKNHLTHVSPISAARLPPLSTVFYFP